VADLNTGLSYMQQRYYDPVAMRFLSVDPVAASPLSFNRYWYANDNPYKYIDPDGREVFDCRGSSSCPSQIKIADLKNGDVVKTDGVMIRVDNKTGDLRLTFKDPLSNGSSAAKVGPRIVPEGPPGVNRNANVDRAKWMDPFQFRDAVKNKGPWDYKQLGGKYEHFGNFNYGATGRSVGFPGEMLLQEAGRYQSVTRTSSPAWGSPGVRFFPSTGTGSFGDDPVDQFWIQQGIRYYDEGGH
jgi:RHS repeat-associated protein